jgi:beta-lactamase class A
MGKMNHVKALMKRKLQSPRTISTTHRPAPMTRVAAVVWLTSILLTGRIVARQVAGPAVSVPQACGLVDRWTAIPRDPSGTVAVSARHVEAGDTASLHGAVPLHLHSVFNGPIALAVLREVDRGRLSIDAPVVVTLRDLSPGLSPIADRVKRDGDQRMTVRELLRVMLVDSDNSAADILMRRIDGPSGVARYLQDEQLTGIDVSLYERQNAEIYLGVPFPADSPDPLAVFSRAVAVESNARKTAAARVYSSDPRNSATADAFVALLARLQQGAIASPVSTSLVLDWMTASTSFPTRLKGQLPAGRSVAHKTGTSGTTDGVTAVTNDAGLITLPDGSHLALAVFLKDSTSALPVNDDVIARMARAAYDCWTKPASRGAASAIAPADLASFVKQTMADAEAAGFVHVRDVRTGDVLAHVSRTATGADDPALGADSPVPPLSVIKVLVAASWIQHGLADVPVRCTPASRAMLVDEMIESGCDSAGADMAIELRRRIGGAAVLAELRADGVAPLSLRADATDAEWGRVLTLGEEQVPVTPACLSAILARIGRRSDAFLEASARQRLLAALESVAQRGTATSIKDALAGTGWRIGGKTGTGPGQCGDHCDGWFASLVSDPTGGRYVVLAFVKERGHGGGVAATLAAKVASHLTALSAFGITGLVLESRPV